MSMWFVAYCTNLVRCILYHEYVSSIIFPPFSRPWPGSVAPLSVKINDVSRGWLKGLKLPRTIAKIMYNQPVFSEFLPLSPHRKNPIHAPEN